MTYTITELPQPGATIRSKAYAACVGSPSYQHYLDWIIKQKKQWLWSVGRESTERMTIEDTRAFDQWLSDKYLTRTLRSA